MVVGGALHYTHDSHSGQNGIKFSPRLQSFFTITGSSLGLGCRSCYSLVEVADGRGWGSSMRNRIVEQKATPTGEQSQVD